MEHIIEPTPEFDFSQLTCISPSSLSGGHHFIRILHKSGQKPFYIQPPKCITKQGIVKAGKKMYCDLLFKHEDEIFTEFLGALETYCQAQLFESKEKWFESDLTEHDIENSFSPTTKIFKSGKLYSVRTNIPIRLGKCALKIFDENEHDVPLESVKENTQVMSIIEIQGIRCSARNFQIEMEIKQMMMLKPVDLFEKCIFTKPNAENTLATDSISSVEKVKEDISENIVIDKSIENDNITETIDNIEQEANLEQKKDEHNEENMEDSTLEPEPESESILDDGVCEIDLSVPTENEEMKLKKRNDVYYEMYKEAKRKAKVARDFALASYLEAKQIKHNYLSEEPSDDEMENEEKELEELDLES